MRILHLSDLHFGIKASKERTREEIAVRNFYINDLINGLGSIAKKEPLDYIFITWNKKSEKIKIKSGKRRENNSDKPLKYSFSVLWWTR